LQHLQTDLYQAQTPPLVDLSPQPVSVTGSGARFFSYSGYFFTFPAGSAGGGTTTPAMPTYTPFTRR